MNDANGPQASSGQQPQPITPPAGTGPVVQETKTQGKRGKYIIEIDRNKCISVGNCVAITPDIFDLDEEQIAVMKDPKTPLISDDETILMSARSCPTQAIIIKDSETGAQIFP